MVIRVFVVRFEMIRNRNEAIRLDRLTRLRHPIEDVLQLRHKLAFVQAPLHRLRNTDRVFTFERVAVNPQLRLRHLRLEVSREQGHPLEREIPRRAWPLREFG